MGRAPYAWAVRARFVTRGAHLVSTRVVWARLVSRRVVRVRLVGTCGAGRAG